MESKISSTCLDGTSSTEATDRGNAQSLTSYAGLNAPPRFVNSGADHASYQSARANNSTHQCYQCYQCNQCHQCIASSDVVCPDTTTKKSE